MGDAAAVDAVDIRDGTVELALSPEHSTSIGEAVFVLRLLVFSLISHFGTIFKPSVIFFD